MSMYKTLKGMRDLLPEDTRVWQVLENRLRNDVHAYGFSEIRTPVVESASLFSRSAGELSDIVQKEQYTFEDKNGDQVSLRPEGTAPIVRALIQHSLMQKGSAKLYYISPMFRRERPQKGRYRQHFQLGVEYFGNAHPYADVEVISLLHTICENVGVPEPRLHINSIGDEECRPNYRNALQDYLNKNLDALDETSRLRVDENPMRIFDSKVESTQEVLKEAPLILDYLNDECKSHFNQVQEGLTALGVPFEINPRIVRGLDYYTHTAFELIGSGLGSQNTVGGGGRYNKLVEQLGGPSTPAVGFGMGLDRLMMISENLNVQKRSQGVMCSLVPEANSTVLELGTQFRKNVLKSLTRVSLELVFESKNLKSALKYADKHDADWVAVVGEDEMKVKEVWIKFLKTGTQHKVSMENFVKKMVELTNVELSEK